MAIEIVAGRMMAKQVGSSLYTWTSVIGVVLAGITVGNFLGGRIADRFEVRPALGVLFVLAAAATSAIPLLDREMAWWSRWETPSETWSWPSRIAAHAIATFLLPSTAAGLLGPPIAKLALGFGRSAGRIVGNVYAWGALGSIAGTFAAGFYLVAALGSHAVLYSVAALLAALGFATHPRGASFAFAVLWPLAAASGWIDALPERRLILGWSLSEGRLEITATRLPQVIYERESQYSSVRVVEDKTTGFRKLYLDNLVHAVWTPSAPLRLDYGYEQIYAAITERFGKSQPRLRALFLGGGGYVFPRYVHAKWPESSIVVAEIDPEVTEAAFAAFGLRREDAWVAGESRVRGAAGAGRRMEIYHLDARNLVEDLVVEKRRRADFEPFDFIYGDAFNDFSVPYHLVTREFAEKLKELLRPGTGLYLMNVIDIYASARFLSAIYNTLKQVFPHVYVVMTQFEGPAFEPEARDTFVVIAALEEKDLEDLGIREEAKALAGALFREERVRHLERQSRGIVLADDHSPVENLLERVVRRRGMRAGAK